ncbi:MAG: HAD-IIIC family phosphatase [Deltaproteobacteria bacterium]
MENKLKEYSIIDSRRRIQLNNEISAYIKLNLNKCNAIAVAIRNEKNAIEKALLDNLSKVKHGYERIQENQSRLPDFVKEEISPFIYYLTKYLTTGSHTYLSLYVGEKSRQIYYLDLVLEEYLSQARQLTKDDKEVYLRTLKMIIPLESILILENILNSINEIVTAQKKIALKILFIGDCIQTDIIDFLIPDCSQDEISILPTRITLKNSAEVNDALMKMVDRGFDMIFFSPFTYEYSREYGSFLSRRNIFIGPQEFKKTIDHIIEATSQIIDTLVHNYDCNIIVHNTCGVRRVERNVLLEVFDTFLTSRNRRAARKIINRWLEGFVIQKNKDTFDHLFIYDEEALLNTYRELELGRFIYHGFVLHTTFIGKVISQTCRDILFARAFLLSKKIIVCDLDNTLWEGIIGEKAVVPYAKRQAILCILKEKGIILAINSKNNPRDVSWDGNLLQPSDFAATCINWEPKVNNIKKIEIELNIKSKDFIVLDDSAIERELIKNVHPDVCVLDPGSDRTWRLLRLWATLLGNETGRDRTKFYRDERERRKVLSTEESSKDNLIESLNKLELKVKVRPAKHKDLKRVVELINRTNQFNLCGTRTSYAEIKDWHNSSNYRLILADAEDKFGPMGTVCVALIEIKHDSIIIPAFVLSCRVIGYKIETAVINYIKKFAKTTGSTDAGKEIIGSYMSTPHNEPCRTMYSDNGFILQEDKFWHFKGMINLDVPWITVTHED